jgi:hypothetical protein
MPGDPKEARAHAANCTQLAETTSSPTLQKTFADLADQWNRLANELEDAHALLKALNELDLKEATAFNGTYRPRKRRRSVNKRGAFKYREYGETAPFNEAILPSHGEASCLPPDAYKKKPRTD